MSITRPTLQAQSAGTPANSALTNTNAGNQSHAKLIKAVGGRKRRKISYRGGAVEVPQMNTAYTSTGGPTQTTDYLIKQNAGNQSQGGQNAKYDKLLGGGGYMKWGCSSGGRKKKSCRFNHRHSIHHHGKTTRKHKHSRHHRCNTKRKRH